MVDFLTNLRWFAIAVFFSAFLSFLAWHLATRHDVKPVRRWTGVSLSALFILYHPFSWVPAGYILGLGIGMARAYSTPTGSIYLFTIASSVITGAIAWALAHLLRRAISSSCKFAPREASRSTGGTTARRFGRETHKLILHFAAKPAHCVAPVNSNVRPQWPWFTPT